MSGRWNSRSVRPLRQRVKGSCSLFFSAPFAVGVNNRYEAVSDYLDGNRSGVGRTSVTVPTPAPKAKFAFGCARGALN